jgi:hypothetical protein
MGKLFPDVRPGDLITAADWLRVTSSIETLYDMLGALQSTPTVPGAITILNVLPPGPLRIGTEIHVFGANFGFSTGACRLFLVTSTGSVSVNAFKLGSNDQELIFDVPPVAGVVAAGTSAQLTVSNGVGTATRNVIVVPAQSTLSGSLDVVAMGATPSPIAAGPGPADFEFSIRALTNLDASYLITPLVQVNANQPAWQTALSVLDASKNALAGRMLPLAPGEKKTIYVRLAPVPNNPANAQFSIGLQAGSGGVNANSGMQGYQVGQAPAQPDTTFDLSFDSVQFDPAGSGSLSAPAGSPLRLQLKPNSAAIVTLKADLSVVGNYDLQGSLSGGLVDWSQAVFGATTLNPLPIAAADLTTNGRAVRNIDFLIQAAANPSPNGTVTFTVTRQGAIKSRSIQLDLQRI